MLREARQRELDTAKEIFERELRRSEVSYHTTDSLALSSWIHRNLETNCAKHVIVVWKLRLQNVTNAMFIIMINAVNPNCIRALRLLGYFNTCVWHVVPVATKTLEIDFW